MKQPVLLILGAALLLSFLSAGLTPSPADDRPAEKAPAPPPRRMERLGRSVVAINQGDGKVFVSWRLLGTDPDTIAFNLYRKAGDAETVRLNKTPITRSTQHLDTGVDISKGNAWFVRPVLEGREGEARASFKLPANAPARPYLSIPLRTLPGHTPNDATVADLDGDGEYEVIVKQEMR